MSTNLPPLYKPNTPKGTSFNKQTVIIICLVIGMIIFFGIIAAFTPTKKKGNNQSAFDKSLENDTKTYSNYGTPDVINNMPNSYTGQMQNSNQDPAIYSDLYPNLGPPTIPVQPPQPSMMQPSMINTNMSLQNSKTLKDQESNDALKSPIRFGSFSGLKQQSSQSSSQTGQNQISINPNTILPGNNSQAQNGQDEKRAFMNSNTDSNFYTSSGLRAPLSKFEVKAGTFIPSTIMTGINSDLPGCITAQVRENVYDTISGRFLLIPQGTKIIGIYDSKIAYAQNRLLVSWSRLILPNGKSLDLEGMPGNDISGYAGLKDKTNNHYLKLITGALTTSIFGATSKILSGSETALQSFESLAISGGTKSLADAGTKLFEKDLEIQPTIEITPGMKFNIFVDKDLILEAYKE